MNTAGSSYKIRKAEGMSISSVWPIKSSLGRMNSQLSGSFYNHWRSNFLQEKKKQTRVYPTLTLFWKEITDLMSRTPDDRWRTLYPFCIIELSFQTISLSTVVDKKKNYNQHND